jgi:Asp-tRNA(Asn)/Glu-tRNA(Gln) amidotransferase A subunit family amidase
MTSSGQIHALTAVDLERLYRSRQLSPVEVTKTILSRVERYDPAVKAFALLDSEAALASARQSIPAGLTVEGMPVGLQIIGPKYSDARVLKAARAFEKLRPFPTPKGWS